MVAVGDGRQHQHPLRRQPIPMFAQPADQIGVRFHLKPEKSIAGAVSFCKAWQLLLFANLKNHDFTILLTMLLALLWTVSSKTENTPSLN
jgi:hypothetical protein